MFIYFISICEFPWWGFSLGDLGIKKYKYHCSSALTIAWLPRQDEMWLVLAFELILTNSTQQLMHIYQPFNIYHIMNGQK